MYTQIVKKLMISGNQESQKRTYWAENFGTLLPSPKEFIEYLEGTELTTFDDEESKEFKKKYPIIQNDPHVKFSMWLIGIKMLVVEGWQEINDSKLYNEELGKRFERLFNQKNPANKNSTIPEDSFKPDENITYWGHDIFLKHYVPRKKAVLQKTSLKERIESWKASRMYDKLLNKYPIINANNHVGLCLSMIMIKMACVEGWENLDCDKPWEPFLKELEKRIVRLFPNLIN